MMDPTTAHAVTSTPFDAKLMLRLLIGTVNRYVAQRVSETSEVSDEHLRAVAAAGTAFADLTREIREQDELQSLKQQMDRIEKTLLLQNVGKTRSAA